MEKMECALSLIDEEQLVTYVGTYNINHKIHPT